MRISRLLTVFRTVRPFISGLAVIATAAVLVFTMYFTGLGLQWSTFLSGILVAAVLAEATRVTRAEWVVVRRTAQLRGLKEKLDRETQQRKKAEEVNAASKLRLHLIDEALPTMIAFVDIEGLCQYCNRAFIAGLRLRPEQIVGRHMREVLGAKVYKESATAVRQSLDGHAVHYERTQRMPDGAFYRLSIAHVPAFGENGNVAGFHMLINDITAPSDVHQPAETYSPAQTQIGTVSPLQDGKAGQDMFVDSFSEQIAGHKDVKQIMMAIENGSFHLFCQLITPMVADSGEAEHYEILIRLMEEEESMMPPGAFFPLAEKYGLMKHLDRWVIRHVTEWASRQNQAQGKQNHSMFFINVSSATIGDSGFPEFLQLTLLEHQLRGDVLCFEIPNSELALRVRVVSEFAQRVSQCGCCVAISGFGRDRILFDLIQGFHVDFLKIDGSIVFGMLRSSVDLAKIMAINDVAKKLGIKTIAELTENEETIAKLREIGIDLAQGFGISRPRPLRE